MTAYGSSLGAKSTAGIIVTVDAGGRQRDQSERASPRLPAFDGCVARRRSVRRDRRGPDGLGGGLERRFLGGETEHVDEPHVLHV